MTDTNIKIREHYSATGLTGLIKVALAAIAPESQTLTVGRAGILKSEADPRWRDPLTPSRLPLWSALQSSFANAAPEAG
jgi:hypothetical protein